MADGKHTVLIVDDDRNTREGLERALKRQYQVLTAPDAATALKILAGNKVELVLSDIRMPGLTGIELLAEVRSKHPETLFVLLTAYGSVETAVEAMKAGAYDFLTKPVNLDHLDILLERAFAARDLKEVTQRQETQIQDLRSQLDEKFGMENIIGTSSAMKPVFETIKAAAPTGATVLISGPSGSGKELVARAIHKLSRRAKGPFIAVNCAALPSSLLESELFGHEKGAFTGAESQRKGRFELASGGTLLLDEIGEIDIPTQVKLLRVLEERSFERVGGTETIDTDFRLVAATNKDLKALIESGQFREDLYYRLAVVDIKVPPLRDRVDDIPAMTSAFLKEFATRNEKNVTSIAREALDILCVYPWPGNVRELRNTIEKMVVLARGEQLTVQDVPAQIKEATGTASQHTPSVELLNGSLESTMKDKIIAVLEKHGGNKSRAALELGISRRTLIRKAAQYGL